MPGTDLTACLTEWVQEAIDAAALGDEFTYTVIPALGQVATPNGPVAVPAWVVMVMMRHPLLDNLPLFCKMDIPLLVLSTGNQGNVRDNIHQALGSLRQMYRDTLAELKNGRPVVVPLPPGQIAGN